jgi:hypothetical protein
MTGVVFSILGPALFWLAYPLGPFVAVILAELAVHMVRFQAFRYIVFPANQGYRVNPRRYLAAALPISVAGFVSVALLRHHLGRTSLTLATTAISMAVGFAWSRYIYTKPIAGTRQGILLRD